MHEAGFRALTRGEAIARLLPVGDTLILFHVHPDGDAVGSAFALRRMLEALGSRAYCVCADEIPDRLRFVTDGVQESALPESIPADFAVSRIVAVDTASPAQLGALYERFAGKIDLMLDHHEKGTPYADYYILPGISATGELLAGLLQEMQPAPEPTPALASALYCAISSDTGCFRFSNTSPETLRTAARLVEWGADTAQINHRLFEVKSRLQMAVESEGAQLLQLYADGRIGVIPFPYARKKALGAKDEHLETLVDVARCTEGVEVAVAIRQPEDTGRFRVSMRSSCAVDVAAVCALFGGGGHKKAAGCTVFCNTIAEATDKIVAALLPYFPAG